MIVWIDWRSIIWQNLCYKGNNKFTIMSFNVCIIVKSKVAPVAQLDRAPDYGSGG